MWGIGRLLGRYHCEAEPPGLFRSINFGHTHRSHDSIWSLQLSLCSMWFNREEMQHVSAFSIVQTLIIISLHGCSLYHRSWELSHAQVLLSPIPAPCEQCNGPSWERGGAQRETALWRQRPPSFPLSEGASGHGRRRDASAFVRPFFRPIASIRRTARMLFLPMLKLNILQIDRYRF